MNGKEPNNVRVASVVKIDEQRSWTRERANPQDHKRWFNVYYKTVDGDQEWTVAYAQDELEAYRIVTAKLGAEDDTKN